jgi:hypothetical protein
VDRQTSDPPGGAIDRDGHGEPTGILKDNAMDLVERVMPAPSREQNKEAARVALREAARLGVIASVQPSHAIDDLRFAEAGVGRDRARLAYTRGSAFAEFTEGDKGTLEVGKLGDVAVFGADLWSRPPRDILTTPVDMTVVGGRVVFEREGA